jgi:hypothetical protein
VTGHSLGGGVTGMLALIWFDDDQLRDKDKHYFPLAPPLCFSEEFNPHIDGCVTSIIHGNDCVPRLSLGTIEDLFKVIEFFREEEEKEGSQNTA